MNVIPVNGTITQVSGETSAHIGNSIRLVKSLDA